VRTLSEQRDQQQNWQCDEPTEMLWSPLQEAKGDQLHIALASLSIPLGVKRNHVCRYLFLWY